ncbi:MAG: ATP-binding protein [Bacteroidota bacterium]
MIELRISLLYLLFLLSLASLQAQDVFSVEHQKFQKEYFKESTYDISDYLKVFKAENDQYDFIQIQAAEFQPNPEHIDLDAKDVYWLKLKLEGHSKRDSTFLFRIGKGVLSCKRAEIYTDDNQPQVTGSDISIAQKPLEAHANYFTVFLKQNETKTIYIKLNGFFPYHRDKMKRLSIYHSNKRLEATFVPPVSVYWNGILLGTVLIPIFYFITLFFIQRERIHLYYVIMVVSALLVFLFNIPNSFIFPLLPNNPDLSRTIWWLGVYFTIFGLLKFTIAYLELPKRWKKGMKLINNWLIIKAVLVFLELPYISYYLPDLLLSIIQVLQRITTFLSLLIPVYFGFVAKKRQSKLASYFLIAAIVFIVGSTFHTIAPLILKSWYERGDHPLVTSYILYVSFLLMLILLAIGTGYKMNLLKRKKAQADQLKELDALKTQLYINIAHDFRTPLSVIKGMSDEIALHEEEKSSIKRNANNLLDLINEMLDLSKLESGKAQLDLVQADMIEYLKYVTHSFHSAARLKNINLDFFSLEKKLLMDFDANKITKIISNLISNALKFTPEYGSIKVIAQRQNKQLTIAVQDTGQGIAEEDQASVFDRYQQATNNHQTSAVGTGIGLSLVKELVKLMEGEIELESTLGEGSTFFVHLPINNKAPLGESAIKEKTEIAQAEEVTPSIPSIQGMPSLLIIEDTLDVINYLKKILQEKYRVLTAMDGEAGIALALEEIPDIIISDVMMPKKNGIEVVKTLKRDLRTSHIPIVLLTAKGDQEGKLEGYEVGADAYLVKPFDKRELFVRLRQLIDIRQLLQKRFQGFLSTVNAHTAAESDDPELQFLQQLEKVVLDNISNEDFRVEPHLCRAMTMSRPQLFRKMKALLNQSPSKYIRQVRMQRAHYLLQQSDMLIGDIADAVGYRDHANFSKAFMGAFGTTPSEVREVEH